MTLPRARIFFYRIKRLGFSLRGMMLSDGRVQYRAYTPTGKLYAVHSAMDSETALGCLYSILLQKKALI